MIEIFLELYWGFLSTHKNELVGEFHWGEMLENVEFGKYNETVI